MLDTVRPEGVNPPRPVSVGPRPAGAAADIHAGHLHTGLVLRSRICETFDGGKDDSFLLGY